MTEKLDKNLKVYQFSDLSRYSFKQRLIIRAAGLAFYILINLIAKTLRFEFEGSGKF